MTADSLPQGIQALALAVIARALDDISTMRQQGPRLPRIPLRPRWNADSEEAWRWICEETEDFEFWCDVADVHPDTIAAECAERMAQSPIGGLL